MRRKINEEKENGARKIRREKEVRPAGRRRRRRRRRRIRTFSLLRGSKMNKGRTRRETTVSVRGNRRTQQNIYDEKQNTPAAEERRGETRRDEERRGRETAMRGHREKQRDRRKRR